MGQRSIGRASIIIFDKNYINLLIKSRILGQLLFLVSDKGRCYEKNIPDDFMDENDDINSMFYGENS